MSITQGAPAHGHPSHLLPISYKDDVSSWLKEDTPSFDYGGFVVGEESAEARLLAKSPGVLAGVPWVTEVFKQLGCSTFWHVSEGAVLTPTTDNPKLHVATVQGPVRHLLLGERVALNLLARCSGIATQTQHTLALVRKAGYKNTLAGTRKTTPGFRMVEKYGMLVGGADPHRHDLSSMVMLKDNHIGACSMSARRKRGQDAGSDEASSQEHGAESDVAEGDLVDPNTAAIHKAIAAARSAAGFALKIEVECQSYSEAVAAILGGADIVMLDNFTPEDLKDASRRLKDNYHVNSKSGSASGTEGKSTDRKRREFLIEVSGGLTEENVADYVCDDVNVISTSSIHQGVRHVDFSLKVVQNHEVVDGSDSISQAESRS